MINILLCGIGGKMGGNIRELLKEDQEARLVCGVDPVPPEHCGVPVYSSFGEVKERVDVIVDFSSPAALKDELAFAAERGIPAVLATTGYTDEQRETVARAAERTAIFQTANFSLGVNLLVELVRRAAETLGDGFDIEIVEKHHNRKADAPSGTALMLADSANAAFENAKPYLCGREGTVGRRGKEIGIHAVRGGTIVGEHEVLFCGEDEIVTLSHSARSKTVFAAGAVRAAKWLAGKPAGRYDMKDLLKELET